MMLRKSLFALSAVLLLGATAACGDDDNKKKDDNNNGDVSCDENPNQDKCQTGGDDDPCVANPDQDICKMDDARDALAYSYVNGLVIPDESSPCCWDFAANSNEIDKDVFDNKLGDLLGPDGIVGMIGDDINIDEVLTDLFEDDTLTLLLEYKHLAEPVDKNGRVDIALHLGETQGEGDTWEARNSGQGQFKLGEKLTGITGFTQRGTITAQAETFPLTLDLRGFVDPAQLEELRLPNEISISLSKVRLALKAIEAETNKISNDVTVTEDRGKTTNFLTGLISGDELADVLNEVLGHGGACENISGDVVTFTDDVERDPDDIEDGVLSSPLLEAVDGAALGACLQDLGLDQGTANIIAGFIPTIGGFFDVDADGNGVADGLSIGLFLSIAGAEIVE